MLKLTLTPNRSDRPRYSTGVVYRRHGNHVTAYLLTHQADGVHFTRVPFKQPPHPHVSDYVVSRSQLTAAGLIREAGYSEPCLTLRPIDVQRAREELFFATAMTRDERGPVSDAA